MSKKKIRLDVETVRVERELKRWRDSRCSDWSKIVRRHDSLSAMLDELEHGLDADNQRHALEEFCTELIQRERGLK